MGQLKSWLVLICLLMMPLPSAARQSIPVDVFIEYDQQQLRVYFTNAVTGLSAVTIIDGLNADEPILDRFWLARNGIVFRHPADALPYLIAPSGTMLRLEFIPQRTDGLLGVEWAVSPDGRTIAWAELYFQDGVWQATLYTALMDGTELRQLPPLPARSPLSSTRVAMVAVTDGGERVFFDMEHPTAPRRPNDEFRRFREVWLYQDIIRTYSPLPSEVDCFCPAQIVNDGRTYVRLEEPIVGTGYGVRLWDLDSGTNRLISGIEANYQQVGRIHVTDDGDMVVYAMSDGTGESESALVIADMVAGIQRVVSAPAAQEWRPMALINRDQEAIIVDLEGGTTYKMNLTTENIDLVANKIWLGVLEG